MQLQTIRAINAVTQAFYAQAAMPFSHTRQQKWSGWERLLPDMRELIAKKGEIRVLDLGCGNGRFGMFLHASGLTAHIAYTGWDSETELLNVAKKQLSKHPFASLELKRVDLIEELLSGAGDVLFEVAPYDVIVAFGLLHHIPGTQVRQELFARMSRSLEPQGVGIVAAWQLALDKRFARKLVPCEQVGIAAADLEKNDFFVDWQTEVSGVRYYHFADEREMGELCRGGGARPIMQFYADGRSGRLNFYFAFTPADLR